MFYIIHVLFGSLIATEFHSLLLMAAICLIGHFILDMIPHWDGFWDKKQFQATDRISIKKSTFIIHSIDFLFAIAIIISLYHKFDSRLIIFTGFISLLPDIMKVGYLTRLKNNRRYMKYLRFHSKIQKDTNWKIGLLTQAIISIVLLLLLF